MEGSSQGFYIELTSLSRFEPDREPEGISDQGSPDDERYYLLYQTFTSLGDNEEGPDHLEQQQQENLNHLEQQQEENINQLEQQQQENINQLEQRLQENFNLNHIEKFKVDMYSDSFQYKMFLGSLLLSFLCAIGIGLPLFLLFILLLCCGQNFIPNFCWNLFLRGDYLFRIQIGMVSTFYLIHGLLTGTLMDFDLQKLYHFQFALIFSFTSPALESFCNDKFVEILEKIQFNSENFKRTRFHPNSYTNLLKRFLDLSILIKQTLSRNGGDTAPEERERIVNDLNKKMDQSGMRNVIQHTISRLEINMSFSYFTFFDPTPNHLLRDLKRRDELLVQERAGELINKRKSLERNLLREISKFEKQTFYYRYFTEKNKFDNEKAHVVALALDLVEKTKHSFLTFSAPLILGLIIHLPIMITHVVSFVEPDFTVAGLLKVLFWESYSGFPISCFLYWTVETIRILKFKHSHMNELSELISPKKKRQDNGKDKLYPTLNFLEPMNLRAWVCLRKILMHLQDEKLQGHILAVTTVMIMDCLTIIIVALYYFKILGSPEVDYSFYLLIFGMKAFLSLFSFSLIIDTAADVNAQFQIHRNLIQANKERASELFENYPHLIGEDRIVPGDEISKEGFKFLKKEFGENLTLEVQQKIKIKRDKLMEAYDIILQGLYFEENQNRISILGSPITDKIFKTLFTYLLPLLGVVMKFIVPYLYSISKENSKQA